MNITFGFELLPSPFEVMVTSEKRRDKYVSRRDKCLSLEQLGPYSVGSVATLGPLLPAASRRKATGSHGFSLLCLFPNPIDLAL